MHAPDLPMPALPTWTLKGRRLLPIVQGGMGVGISAHRLAGHVARLGAVGTVASIDLRHHQHDLMARTQDCADKADLDRLNLIALDREVRGALAAQLAALTAAGEGARVILATVRGTWSDSSGNIGAFVFTPAGPGTGGGARAVRSG